MTFTISYDQSSPASARMAYYNAIAEKENFHINWTVSNSDADAILLTGHENFHELQHAGFSVVVSKNSERRTVALFGLTFAARRTIKLAGDFKWQAESAVNFLKKYLPQNREVYDFEIITNNHCFDERIVDLDKGLIDIMLCPLEDINLIDQTLVKSFKYMVLPLFECPPAFFQGCTGIYTKNAGSMLIKKIDASRDELTIQRFNEEQSLIEEDHSDNYGVFSLDLPLLRMSYLAARDNGFYEWWTWYPRAQYPADKLLFSTTGFMKDFFSYEYYPDKIKLKTPVVFVASHKSVQTIEIIEQLSERRVWAAGAKTWLELARKGVWVEGCADGLGLEALSGSWSGGFLNIAKHDVEILTNAESVRNWATDDWTATATYKLVPSLTPEIIAGLQSAEIVFWTSYQQYEACKQYLHAAVIHACPAGRTAVLLMKDGIRAPIVFPSIKAFNWFITSSPPAKEG